MKDIRQGAKTEGTHPLDKVGGKVTDSKELTCKEAQVEELLSKGESTEGEDEEAEQFEKPAEAGSPTSQP